MQRPEQFGHALEHGGEIGGLLVLGVGAFADVDVDPVAGELLLGERFAAGEPVGGIDRFDDDGGDPGSLCRILAVSSLTAEAISAFSEGALRKLE